MNDSAAAASRPGGPTDQKRIDNLQALQTGFKLARASQLTMVRLQLALHGSKPDTAMQALDNLLDIDAEMAGIEETLIDHPGHLTDDAVLSGFIRFQKKAIASEKHALTGGDRRSQVHSTSIPAICDLAGKADLSVQALFSGDEAEIDPRANSWHWIKALIVALIVTIVGIGLIVLLVSQSLVALASL